MRVVHRVEVYPGMEGIAEVKAVNTRTPELPNSRTPPTTTTNLGPCRRCLLLGLLVCVALEGVSAGRRSVTLVLAGGRLVGCPPAVDTVIVQREGWRLNR